MNLEYGFYFLLLILMISYALCYVEIVNALLEDYYYDEVVQKLFTLSQYVVNSGDPPNNLTDLPDISQEAKKLNISVSMGFSPSGDICIYRVILYRGEIKKLFLCTNVS